MDNPLMRALLALLLALITGPAFAQFSNLTVTPTHPTAGLALAWTGPAGTKNINRWTDANPTPAVIGTSTTSTYTDSTAVVNTIYYYSVSQGAASSNVFNGVVSDITQPFNCPPMVPVDPSKLGVDRTESFTAADGTTVAFTVQAPIASIAGANIISVPPCAGASGCSDYNNINNALIALPGGGTVQLSAGDYHLDNGTGAVGAGLVYPIWGTGGFDFNVNFGAAVSAPAINDLILAGASVASGAEPTTHVFFNQRSSLAGSVVGVVTGGDRHLARDITFDWDFITAIPGTLVTATPTQCMALISVPNCQLFNVTNGTYYVPDPTNPPPVYVVDAYNFTTRTYELRAGGRGAGGCAPPTVVCPFNPNFAMDGLYYYAISPELNTVLFPTNTPAIMIVRTGEAFLPGTDAFNQSFENIRIYGGGGGGLIQGPHSQGLRLSNFVIERKPDALLAPGEQPRYVSIFGDNDSNGSQGNVLIENSQFGLIEDDTYYMRGAVAQMQRLTRNDQFIMDAGLVINHAPGPTDVLKFMDPYTYKQIGTMPVTSWTSMSCMVPAQCMSGTLWHFTFPAVPELNPYINLPAAQLPWFGQPAWSAPNFIVRNSCSHDTHGRLSFLNSNGLVENNVLSNGYFGPLVAGINFAQPGLPTNFGDGPGARNIIFRGNKVIGAGYGTTDFKTIWAPVVVSNGYPQTGWGSAAISVGSGLAGVGADGFYPPAVASQNYIVSNNFISNTPGLCILVTSATDVVVNGNICVDANAVPFAAGFQATYCGGASQGWQMFGANQPWCLAKTAAQGSIMLVNDANVDTTTVPNQFLGTSIGTIFSFDSSTVHRTNIIVGPLFH
jgi:hypothetical protein